MPTSLTDSCRGVPGIVLYSLVKKKPGREDNRNCCRRTAVRCMTSCSVTRGGGSGLLADAELDATEPMAGSSWSRSPKTREPFSPHRGALRRVCGDVFANVRGASLPWWRVSLFSPLQCRRRLLRYQHHHRVLQPSPTPFPRYTVTSTLQVVPESVSAPKGGKEDTQTFPFCNRTSAYGNTIL